MRAGVPAAPACERCRFYEESTNAPSPGLCRRNPPFVSIFENYGWPTVLKNDWCGEFRQAE